MSFAQAIPQYLGLHSEEATSAAELSPVDPGPDPGYVYFCVSPAMPGFVQIASSAENPGRRKWTLETMSGVTRFHVGYAARTSDRAGLEARFREIMGADQIPNHPDLFKFPLRFASRILEAEAKAFPPAPEPPAPANYRPHFLTIVLAVVLTVNVVIRLPHESRQRSESVRKVAVVPAYRHPLPQMRLAVEK